MRKRFGILAVVALAFAVAPTVALAGDSDSDKESTADRVAKRQANVDSFVACLRDANVDVPDLDVAAIANGRSIAHRGRGARGWHGWRRGGDMANRVARFVVRSAELDRSDEAVKAAVNSCRDALRTSLAEGRQGDVDAVAACLADAGHGVQTVDLSERTRLASKRAYLRGAARVMVRAAGLQWREDAGVRSDAHTCIKTVKEAATT